MSDNNKTFDQLDIAIDEFMAIASHKLLSPLTVIKWTLETVNKDYELSTELLDKLRIIEESVNKLEDFSHVLLKISDIRTENFSTDSSKINIQNVFSEVILSFKGLLDSKNINLNIKYNGLTELNMAVDVRIFREIVRNIIENAFIYSVEDGFVKIETLLKGKSKLLIRVSDNGIGIPTEEAELIFRPFYRAKNVEKLGVKGYGLSLHYVKVVLDKAKGDIKYFPNNPKGSVFELYIPLV